MIEGHVFTLLYPVVPLVGLAGFIPQISTLLRTQDTPSSISLSTWSMWTLTWLISFGYAVCAIQDVLFAITAGLNLIGHILIVGLTMFKRHKYRSDSAIASLAEAYK